MPDQPPPLAYPDPPLTDGVVVLRRWEQDDLSCVEEGTQDPDTPKGTTVPATFTPTEGLAWIERQRSRHDEGTGLSQAIVETRTRTRHWARVCRWRESPALSRSATG
jgi:ribosomal-protein-alanine N-acetyltransferase